MLAYYLVASIVRVGCNYYQAANLLPGNKEVKCNISTVAVLYNHGEVRGG